MTNRPTILVDMDGVLADFDAHLLALTGPMLWPEGYTQADQRHRFSTDILNPVIASKIRKTFIQERGYFQGIPEVAGAVEGFHQLAERADLWIVTKPYEANPSCRDDKARWVHSHLGPEWVKRLILAPDKSLVRGDILLDDAPKLEWIGRATWTPVLYPWPWNGPGSEWAGLDRWRWDADIDDLIGIALRSTP